MQLTLAQLKRANGSLRQAYLLVAGVSSLFFDAGDSGTSARLNDISARLNDEITALEKRSGNLSSEENA